MVMSLFSVFDPVGVIYVSFNWMVLVVTVLCFPLLFYIMSWGVMTIIVFVMNKMGLLVSEISFPNFLGLVSMGVFLFLYLGMVNSVGLFPYVFIGTSHLVVTFSFGLVFWFSFFIMGWINNLNFSAAHLVPEGSPLMLSPFMVLVEGVSQVIRPVTLSVRLMANLVSGHLIIGLVAMISSINMIMGVMSVFLQMLVFMLEAVVALVQAFVFMLLIVLYSLDYY